MPCVYCYSRFVYFLEYAGEDSQTAFTSSCKFQCSQNSDLCFCLGLYYFMRYAILKTTFVL